MHQLVQAPLHLHGSFHCAVRVIRLIGRRTENRHHRVADELVQRALILEDDVYHVLEIGVEQADKRGRILLLAHGGKASDVAEEHGYVAYPTLAINRQTAVRNLCCERGSNQTFEALSHGFLFSYGLRQLKRMQRQRDLTCGGLEDFEVLVMEADERLRAVDDHYAKDFAAVYQGRCHGGAHAGRHDGVRFGEAFVGERIAADDGLAVLQNFTEQSVRDHRGFACA